MVYLFLAEGCEEIEALTPVDILRRAGVEVVTVGVGSKMITSSHGITISADIEEAEIVLGDDVEAVILPGGMPGTLNLDASEAVNKALEYCAESSKVIAAICAAPTVLKNKGLLEGKRATVFPNFVEKLGNSYVDEDVVVDGNIITARGMGVSLEFSFALLEVLKGAESAEKMKKTVCYPESCRGGK